MLTKGVFGALITLLGLALVGSETLLLFLLVVELSGCHSLVFGHDNSSSADFI